MKDLETKNLKIRKFKMDDVEDVYKNLATIQELKIVQNIIFIKTYMKLLLWFHLLLENMKLVNLL